MVLDQPERLDRLPVVHDDDGHPVEERHGHREGQRGGVVERAGQEVRVDTGGVVLVVAAEVHRGQRAHRRRGAVDALGPPRGAGGVEHLGADHRILDVGAVLGGDDGVVHLEALQEAAGVDLDETGPARLGRHGHLVAQPAVAHERLGLAVLDDVGRLGPGEVPVDGGEAQADALGGVEHLEELGPVRAHEGDGVAGPQAAGAQRPGQPVDVGVEVRVGAVAVRRHEREVVGDPLRPPGVEHPLCGRGALVLGHAHERTRSRPGGRAAVAARRSGLPTSP